MSFPLSIFRGLTGRLLSWFCIGSLLVTLTHCKTVVNSEVIGTERINSSKEKTDSTKYKVELKDKPTIKKPKASARAFKEIGYKYENKIIKEKKIKINRKGRINAGMITMMTVGGGTALLGFAPFTPAARMGVAIPFSSVFFSGLIGFLVKKDPQIKYKTVKQKRRSKSNFPEEFQDETHEIKYEKKPLTSQKLYLNYNDIHKSFRTNQKGNFSFHLVNDFSLTETQDNQPIKFDVSSNHYSFQNQIKLNPSNWMHKYVKVTAPKCNISIANAVARKGMRYQILDQELNKYKIQVFNDKQGWINKNCVETFYSIPKERDIGKVVKAYVEDTMNQWMKQGEFEPPEEYKKRLTRKDQKLKEFTQMAMTKYQRDYSRLIDWQEASISRYDPNNETFEISIPGLETFVISVPLSKAKQFKKNWEQVRFENKDFMLVDGQWQLSSVKLNNRAMNYSVTYNNDLQKTYNPTNQFSFTLDSAHVKLPEPQKPTAQKEKKELDPYSVNTNLPQSNMKRSDAIAVVIGNANYKQTKNVEYAINDAQLMKTYLTNVLGFKEGNIIFKRNATKGEMEGIFGTESSHKAKLYNWAKPDSSSQIFVFYSGHGAPNKETKQGYFVPTDADPHYIQQQGYALSTFYKNLSKIPAASKTVVLDACFSGANILDDVSAVRVEVKPKIRQKQDMAVLTSSSGNQYATWYNAKEHGLFTWFFLKALHDYKTTDANNDRQVTIGEVYQYVADNNDGVPYYARRLHGEEQTPTLKGGEKQQVVLRY